MEKLSNEQLATLFHDGATTIRKQASKIVDLEEKLASKELRERTEKIASSMHDKGVRTDVTRELLVDELEKEAAAGRLEAIEKAVEMIGPDMGKFAHASRNPNSDDQGNVSSDLERFIVGGVG